MFKYSIDLGEQIIDLDYLMGVLKDEICYKGAGEKAIAELKYLFGDGGYKFIIETLQEQVDNIKARQPSEE